MHTFIYKLFFMKYRLLLVFIVAVSLVSCRSKKKILYFQNPSEAKEQASNYELKIQTDDLLYIKVYADDQESVKIFNSFGNLYEEDNNSNNSNAAGNSNNGNRSLRGYLVDTYGFIDFPVLGRLQVANLTKSSLVKLLQEKLSVYVKNPVVNVRFLNFKVTVLGESGAKTLTFDTEKVSLPQLLSQIGDMNYDSERYKIVVVRDLDGIKTFGRIDMTQASVVNSPYYYLAQNDVIYIEPTRNAIDRGAIPSSLRNASIILGTVVSIMLIFNNIK